MNRDIQQLIRRLERQGLVVKALRGGHYRVQTRGGRYLATFPSTPSCRRSIPNAEAAIRRALRQRAPKAGADPSVRSISRQQKEDHVT